MSAASAAALLALGWWLGIVNALEAAAYAVVLLKGAWVLSRLERYQEAPIGQVAALALLPRTLPA